MKSTHQLETSALMGALNLILPHRTIAILMLVGVLAVPINGGALAQSSNISREPPCHYPEVPCPHATKPGEFSLTCLADRKVLRDELGSIVLLDSDELNRRATRKSSIKAGPGSHAPISVMVYLAIDELGHVLCVSPAERSGPMAGLAVEAAKKWQFQPVLSGTKPIPCVGLLELQVDFR